MTEQTDSDDLNAELARIEAMTDEEILADARARGVDIVEQGARVRAMLLATCRRTREAKARLMADPEPYFAVVCAALNWRECDESQSADRGMNCGCLDRLADAVDALFQVSGTTSEVVSDDPTSDWPLCVSCGKSAREGNHATDLGVGHDYDPGPSPGPPPSERARR